MRIEAFVIDHENQAYETTGDWGIERLEDGTPVVLWVKVSSMGDWRKEMSVAVHEIIEALVCEHLGVDEKDVNAFDKRYELERLPGDYDEPGDEVDAPYYEGHQIASAAERMLVLELGLAWRDYEKANTDLLDLNLHAPSDESPTAPQ